MTEVILSLAAGLALFLFSIASLSSNLQRIIGDRARKWIARFTASTLSGIFVGTLITILLGSSSAVIIVAIVLVNAKALTFRQAMGVVLGANIGTTFTSQLIALDITQYASILMVIGLVLDLIFSSENRSRWGRVVFFFGLLFYGLSVMENSVEPLRSNSSVTNLLQQTENPLRGAMIGAFLTLVIQSSSAAVGMAILLAKKGALSLAGGVAIMLGAELGTCSDTLIATIKGSRAALRTGVFHVVFNALAIGLGLLLFYPFVNMVLWISGNASIQQSVANAHMLFNLTSVFVFYWTVPFFDRFLNRLLPDRTIPAGSLAQ